MNTEKSQSHFGMIAIGKGFATANQVYKALERQIVEQSSTGNCDWIGTILLEQGAIDLAQLDEVLQSLDVH